MKELLSSVPRSSMMRRSQCRKAGNVCALFAPGEMYSQPVGQKTDRQSGK